LSNIILVGFMGTGKSAVGKMLARRLNCPFVDLDRQIEAQAGRSVQQIFEQDGEPAFRKMEAKAVREAAALKDHVIATGGGVMCDEENVQALKSSGVLVCLTASADAIMERTSASLFSRPLLAGADPKQRIEELLKLRAPYYARADITIDTTDRTLKEVSEEILCKIETFKP
jgi:shikimate kinase